MLTSNLINPISVKLRSAGKDIVASGSVHTFDSKSLEMDIANLSLKFEFIEDKDAQRIVREIIDGKSLKLKLFNFSNSLGTGTAQPIEIGTLLNRRLYLSFIAHALSQESSKLVTYTFFVGENVNV